MSKETPLPDWDPRSAAALRDQLAVYDELRRTCPVARSDFLHWSLLRHADVVRALHDPATFSNEVSKHLSVPNGMDAPLHTHYRRVIDPYFSAARMAAIEPACREIAAALLDGLPAYQYVEIMDALAHPYALRAQAAFLDWPAELHGPLRDWVRANQAATRAGDPAATAEVAQAFDRHIRDLLEARRRGPGDGDDVASRLLRDQVDGRELEDAEIVSILRNWTVGELGTIAASVGIVVHFLAAHPRVWRQLADDARQVPAAIDEILRIHPPLIASRRRSTCPVEIGGRRIEAGERLTLMWASANRDEAVFGDANEFRLDRDPELNLLYGKGPHGCPGAPLARMELRVLIEELLARGRAPQLVEDPPPARASYPASGFRTLHVRFESPRRGR